jgi:hypothetical protein
VAHALQRRALHGSVPVNCFTATDEGVVLHADKDPLMRLTVLCLPVRRPTVPRVWYIFGARGKMYRAPSAQVVRQWQPG